MALDLVVAGTENAVLMVESEAKMLSDILNNPLKVSLTIGEKYAVSPTLASGALSSSLQACLLGAILVIAFFIVPASAAFLLTDRLSRMLVLSVSLGIISAVMGYLFAIFADVSISGSMASITGIIFGLIWVFLFLSATEH